MGIHSIMVSRRHPGSRVESRPPAFLREPDSRARDAGPIQPCRVRVAPKRGRADYRAGRDRGRKVIVAMGGLDTDALHRTVAAAWEQPASFTSELRAAF